METASARLKELGEDVHHLSHGLHPSVLEHLGLTAALKGFCRELEHSRGVTVHFTTRDVPNMLPKEVALCLYRVAQEALQNVAKHSCAKQATVEVSVAGDEIHMRIADEGKGLICRPRPQLTQSASSACASGSDRCMVRFDGTRSPVRAPQWKCACPCRDDAWPAKSRA